MKEKCNHLIFEFPGLSFYFLWNEQESTYVICSINNHNDRYYGIWNTPIYCRKCYTRLYKKYHRNVWVDEFYIGPYDKKYKYRGSFLDYHAENSGYVYNPKEINLLVKRI